MDSSCFAVVFQIACSMSSMQFNEGRKLLLEYPRSIQIFHANIFQPTKLISNKITKLISNKMINKYLAHWTIVSAFYNFYQQPQFLIFNWYLLRVLYTGIWRRYFESKFFQINLLLTKAFFHSSN